MASNTAKVTETRTLESQFQCHLITKHILYCIYLCLERISSGSRNFVPLLAQCTPSLLQLCAESILRQIACGITTTTHVDALVTQAIFQAMILIVEDDFILICQERNGSLQELNTLSCHIGSILLQGAIPSILEHSESYIWVSHAVDSLSQLQVDTSCTINLNIGILILHDNINRLSSSCLC